MKSICFTYCGTVSYSKKCICDLQRPASNNPTPESCEDMDSRIKKIKPKKYVELKEMVVQKNF